jgi:tRNA pseudouridine55 synthase
MEIDDITMSASPVNGLLVLDKPVGPTSRMAVDRALAWFPRKTRIGHTGTLDPLASGVLVLCIGNATRLAQYVQDMDKSYIADVIFGARSGTDDAEGPIEPAQVAVLPDGNAVAKALATFVGRIEQVPPAFSAAKVTGRRAYELARRGTVVELAPRNVRIDDIRLLEFECPRARIEVQCGKGTYIRSLARDLGERLGCGAYLASLRRTRVGPFTPENAVPSDADAETAFRLLLPPTVAVAGLPRITLPLDEIYRLRRGQAVPSPTALPVSGDVAVFDPQNALAAIAVAAASGQILRPTKVFPL